MESLVLAKSQEKKYFDLIKKSSKFFLPLETNKELLTKIEERFLLVIDLRFWILDKGLSFLFLNSVAALFVKQSICW